MKKKYLIFFISLLIISNNVKAETIYKDVTEDIEIRYKWYKEIINNEGKYYPLRKITEEDKYDKNNIKYVDTTRINSEFCTYSDEYYRITPRTYRNYKTVYDAKYIIIENIEPETTTKIYYQNKEQTYKVISHENNILVILLNNDAFCDELLFYIDTENKYKISLYRDESLKKLIMSKEFENEKISIPSSKWHIESSAYRITDWSTIPYNETSLTRLNKEQVMCECSEKYVYKYDVTKQYYDDDYHQYVEGYIKDENDYRYYYKGEPIIINNTIEIIKEKIKEIPKIEYIYIENEYPKDEENKLERCDKIIQTKIETQIIEKEINKIPKKVYIIIISLSILVLVLIIKNIVKKNRLN